MYCAGLVYERWDARLSWRGTEMNLREVCSGVSSGFRHSWEVGLEEASPQSECALGVAGGLVPLMNVFEVGESGGVCGLEAVRVEKKLDPVAVDEDVRGIVAHGLEGMLRQGLAHG